MKPFRDPRSSRTAGETTQGRRALGVFAFGALLVPLTLFAPATPDAPPAGLTTGDTAARCSMSFSYGPRLIADQQFFLATGTAESTPAPSAAAALTRTPSPSFVAGETPIVGQIVELHDAHAADADRVRSLLDGHDRAVMVWWGFDTACRPVFGTDPAFYFAEPGLENVIAGVLVDPEHWVDGMPLIQVYNTLQTPIPGLRKRILDRRAAESGVPAPDYRDQVLTASEFWSLISGLPFADASTATGTTPVEPRTEEVILDWARSHPNRWRVHPVYQQVVLARSARQARFAPSDAPPIEGVYRGTVRMGDYEGELCFWLTPVAADPGRSAQELPADYDLYSPAPWDEAPPAVAGFRMEVADPCPPADVTTPPEPRELAPSERLRASSFWLRTDAEIEARPGETRAWNAALRPRDFQVALGSAGVPAPAGVSPRGRVQDQPSALALAQPPSDEDLRLVTEVLTTARVALLDDGRVTIEDMRGPEPITFAVSVERLRPE
jgi:hypothetical protein